MAHYDTMMISYESFDVDSSRKEKNFIKSLGEKMKKISKKFTDPGSKGRQVDTSIPYELPNNYPFDSTFQHSEFSLEDDYLY